MVGVPFNLYEKKYRKTSKVKIQNFKCSYGLLDRDSLRRAYFTFGLSISGQNYALNLNRALVFGSVLKYGLDIRRVYGFRVVLVVCCFCYWLWIWSGGRGREQKKEKGR